MELECFTLFDPDSLFLYLSSKFKNVQIKVTGPSLHNLFSNECLPLITNNNEPIPVDDSSQTPEEIRIRSLLESNLLLYLKESLYTEEGYLWQQYVSNDIFQRVGLFYKYYAGKFENFNLNVINKYQDYCLLCSSFYLKSGQITDENSLEMFRDNLIRSALIDLKKIEEIIRMKTKNSMGDSKTFLSGGPIPNKIDALLASVLVPLSMENESTSEIGAYINSSQVFGSYISQMKKDYLYNFEYFFKKDQVQSEHGSRSSLFKAPTVYLRQNTFQVGFVAFALSALYLTKKFSKSSKT